MGGRGCGGSKRKKIIGRLAAGEDKGKGGMKKGRVREGGWKDNLIA